jgi:hypothetical protein
MRSKRIIHNPSPDPKFQSATCESVAPIASAQRPAAFLSKARNAHQSLLSLFKVNSFNQDDHDPPGPPTSVSPPLKPLLIQHSARNVFQTNRVLFVGGWLQTGGGAEVLGQVGVSIFLVQVRWQGIAKSNLVEFCLGLFPFLRPFFFFGNVQVGDSRRR